ncbi:unnamed protein product [Timema podura]|uniref:Uncharacterized protein n=1 Tax=Timema podura TaxID=61482 RepID=A0ABN7NLT0_TIMPD|nr:unnamed protein product [Timema podura]
MLAESRGSSSFSHRRSSQLQVWRFKPCNQWFSRIDIFVTLNLRMRTEDKTTNMPRVRIAVLGKVNVGKSANTPFVLSQTTEDGEIESVRRSLSLDNHMLFARLFWSHVTKLSQYVYRQAPSVFSRGYKGRNTRWDGEGSQELENKIYKQDYNI